jgi:sterol desaturase/sphingolipid hydroxylase (fatty acid hydroxylase superfamily)
MNIAAFLVEHEAALRLSAFGGALLLLAALQWRWPTRGDGRPARRQLINLALVAIDSLVLRLLFPILAVGLAIAIDARGGGLFGALAWPYWLEFALAVLLLDLAIYWQHRLHHVIPLLWRLHRVHHSDVAVDVTTGVRFHPLEIALSMGLKLGLVWLLGPAPAAVVVFELLLSLGSLITHTDCALPAGLDRRLRWLLVTPSMHRIHHSVWREETDSNFGFHLSLWDRAFGSYRSAPLRPEAAMPVGLPAFRGPGQQGLIALLLQPIRKWPASVVSGDSSHA